MCPVNCCEVQVAAGFKEIGWVGTCSPRKDVIINFGAFIRAIADPKFFTMHAIIVSKEKLAPSRREVRVNPLREVVFNDHRSASRAVGFPQFIFVVDVVVVREEQRS